MNDYARVERLIQHLDARQTDQPSLAELAQVAGLSEGHVHRLFARWAGVTPKDFLQCLTAEHAKQRLRASRSVLDAALDVGLSGPGRLHDLLVSWEALTPGAVRRRGAGEVISWGWTETPWGECAVAWTNRGLARLAFAGGGDPPGAWPADWVNVWESARRREDAAGAADWARRVFRVAPASNGESPWRAWVQGTPFQIKVWQALIRIPPGEVWSYGGLARVLGQPGAARAVGHACGQNPLALLIPCHRVVRETGAVEGYRWGRTRKRALLAAEFASTRLPPALNP